MTYIFLDDPIEKKNLMMLKKEGRYFWSNIFMKYGHWAQVGSVGLG